MRKFLVRLGWFASSLVIVTALLVIITSYYAKQTFNFGISEKKNVLVVGNSHPECAIDDSELPNVFNLAQSGTGYFYDYLKVREVTRHNPQIDSVIIGYTYNDVHKSKDSWFSGDNRIKHKFRSFFFLFEFKDYASIFKANPLHVLVNTPQTIFQNLLRPLSGYEALGGHQSIEKNELEKAKKLKDRHIPDTSLGYSRYQTKYLILLYKFCKENDIKLVLLNAPIHPVLQNIQAPLESQYRNFAHDSLPLAHIIDHANFTVPEIGYRDLEHLNKKGAKMYTDFLKVNGFTDGL